MNLTKRGEDALRPPIRLGVTRRLGPPVMSVSRLAESERISARFLENIFSDLKAAAYIEGIRGKVGGARLLCDPETTKMGELVRFLAGLLTSLGSRGPTER